MFAKLLKNGLSFTATGMVAVRFDRFENIE